MILVLGDSLSAEYGLKPGEGWVPLLEKRLAEQKIPATVVNASISGDTSSGGRARFASLLAQHKPSHVVLELGANDALRGLDPALAKANLDKIITEVKATGAEVMLAGMQAPHNWGEAYVKAFNAIYPGLAVKHGTLLYPFFLDGVVMDAKLNLGDGMHPNAKGVAEIVRRILPKVEELLARVRARRAAAGG